MKKLLFFLFAAVVIFTGCKGLNKAIALKDCDFNYSSISDLKLPSIIDMLGSNNRPLPFSMVINLRVENPSHRDAGINHLAYVLFIDDVKMAEGESDASLDVPAGEFAFLPVRVNADLRELLKGEAKDAVVRVCKNMLGISPKASNFKVVVKPRFDKAGLPPIPIKFKYGGASK